MRKFRLLYKFSLFAGIVPLVGGILIFAAWMIARYLYAFDLNIAEHAGFYWVIVSFFVALTGIGAQFVYAIINWKNLHWGVILAFILIILNIPAVFGIIQWQNNVSSDVFVKLGNKTESNIQQLELVHYNQIMSIGKVRKDESIIFHYAPNYFVSDDRMYLDVDTITLVVKKQGGDIDSIDFPARYYGGYANFELTKQDTIIDKTESIDGDFRF